jgi:hypothetical protein
MGQKLSSSQESSERKEETKQLGIGEGD